MYYGISIKLIISNVGWPVLNFDRLNFTVYPQGVKNKWVMWLEHGFINCQRELVNFVSYMLIVLGFLDLDLLSTMGRIFG